MTRLRRWNGNGGQTFLSVPRDQSAASSVSRPDGRSKNAKHESLRSRPRIFTNPKHAIRVSHSPFPFHRPSSSLHPPFQIDLRKDLIMQLRLGDLHFLQL